jgi:ADP-heptose:LPS heptosyltransferase
LIVPGKLLILELWGMGDLAIATPFLRGAVQRYDTVCLLAKPTGAAMQPWLWPGVTVKTFVAPWTAFRGKYRLWKWPWGEMLRLRAAMRDQGFEIGCSARKDPRDHLLLRGLGMKRRVGFPAKGSGLLLTEPLPEPPPLAHRTESWKRLAERLEIEWSPIRRVGGGSRRVLIHTGAAQRVRVWPLPRFQGLAGLLSAKGWEVEVLCDPDQAGFWKAQDSIKWEAVDSVEALMTRLGRAGAFVGNDSGPGHVAAAMGVPTFTVFGNQRPEWFLPDHPLAGHVPGKPCPHKPCFDSCHYAEPHCLLGVSEGEVSSGVLAFLETALPAPPR